MATNKEDDTCESLDSTVLYSPSAEHPCRTGILPIVVLFISCMVIFGDYVTVLEVLLLYINSFL